MGVGATGSDRTPTRWGGSPRSRAGRSASTSPSRRWRTSTTIPPTRSSTPARSARTRQRLARLVAADGARPAGQRHARHREALPRPRRHRHRLAPRAAGHHAGVGAARLARAGAVPRRDQRRRGGGDVGPHRDAGHRPGMRPARHRRPEILTGHPARLARASRASWSPTRSTWPAWSTGYGARRRPCGRSSPAPTCCCSRPIRAPRSTRWRRGRASRRDHPERLDRSVRRVLGLKRALGLFTRRTVPLDSMPAIVGSAAFQADAAAIAARSIVMVKDSAGVISTDSRALRPPITLVTYAEEENRTVGIALAARAPGAGLRRHAGAALAGERRGQLRLGGRGHPAHAGGRLRHRRPARPQAVARSACRRRSRALIARTARAGPTVLVSLGNPYLISELPEVGSYLIGWRSNAVDRAGGGPRAGGRGTDHRPTPDLRFPRAYARGWGLQRRVPSQCESFGATSHPEPRVTAALLSPGPPMHLVFSDWLIIAAVLHRVRRDRPRLHPEGRASRSTEYFVSGRVAALVARGHLDGGHDVRRRHPARRWRVSWRNTASPATGSGGTARCRACSPSSSSRGSGAAQVC